MGEWLFKGNVEYEYNNNLPRADLERDTEDGTSLNLNFSPGYYFQLTNYSSLLLNIDIEGVKHVEFNGLSRAGGGASLDFFHKFGVGRQVPWIRATALVNRHDFADRQRDGWRYSAGISAGKRFSDRWEAHINYTYEVYRTDTEVDIPFLADNFGIQGDAFDTDSHLLGIGAIYTVNYSLALTAGYTWHTGEVTSTTRRNTAIFNASDAITPDPVYGPGRFAYRIDADTDIYTLGASYAVNNNISLNASYEYSHS